MGLLVFELVEDFDKRGFIIFSNSSIPLLSIISFSLKYSFIYTIETEFSCN
jgi:hypothetical protein